MKIIIRVVVFFWFAWQASLSMAMMEMAEDELSEITGQALLTSDRIDGQGGSNHDFYRMILDAEVALNMNIDHLQLGCGGFNEQTTANACDIDIEYMRLMGLGSGQPGAPDAGEAATSSFILTRPYIELAVKNEDSPTMREIVGFKIGAQEVEGYFGIGRYDTSLPGCTSATSGAGAFHCNRGINRLSGAINARLQGDARGCFALFGCTPNPDLSQQPVLATFDTLVEVYGTRFNRVITSISATSNPDETLGLTLTIGADLNEHLRFLHGFALDPSKPQYAADDFFLSFQRESVAYPTFNKSNAFSRTANPGWWLNIPLAELTGLTAYNVAGSAANLFVSVQLTDADVNQRPADNCYGALAFC